VHRATSIVAHHNNLTKVASAKKKLNILARQAAPVRKLVRYVRRMIAESFAAASDFRTSEAGCQAGGRRDCADLSSSLVSSEQEKMLARTFRGALNN